MKQVKVGIKFEEGVKHKPAYQKISDAGADIFPLLKEGEKYTIMPGERKLFKTGIKLELPDGYEVQVRPRSGLAFKKGISVLNTPGTIDAGYKGDVGVILINHGTEDFEITNDTAIAQLVLKEVIQAVFEEVDELSESDRGEGGFGHTGNM